MFSSMYTHAHTANAHFCRVSFQLHFQQMSNMETDTVVLAFGTSIATDSTLAYRVGVVIITAATLPSYLFLSL